MPRPPAHPRRAKGERMKSLLEQLPGIVAEGKREAERVMERAESAFRLGLQTRELVIPSRDTNTQDMLLNAERAFREMNPANTNRLIYGDNLLAIAALLGGGDETASMRGKIDLIYIDPPYDSKADYRTKITLPGEDIEQKPTAIEQFAYSDTWQDGTASYIAMMTPRLALMRELMSNSGSIYVQCDHRANAFLRLVMDELFGRDHFQNEIIWCYKSGGAGGSGYAKKHDTILYYTKGTSTIFNSSKEKSYMGIGYNTGNKNVVLYDDKDGLGPYTLVNVKDWWSDIGMIATSKGRLYPTQKPEGLLERIINTSSDKNCFVADFFSGSGTTAAVAERLGRRWIACDLGKPACMVARKRLIDGSAAPFHYQHIGDYQVEQMRSTMGSKFRIGDLAEIVLGLYGALPLPIEENPNKNMGRVQGSKTLVLADSPNKMTGLTTLRRAIEIRDNLMGGWDRVVVLGWNFSPTIGHDIEALGQGDRLEVLVIPPDLLDRLKKKGHKLKADEVRFSSLQYLKLGAIDRRREDKSEGLSVTIANYVLLSPDALNLDEANRDKLQKVINTDPLALIEYWSVDPDYDGEVFRSVWQDYRENTENDADPYRVVTTARLTGLPKKEGPRRICVRVVDVFGFEAEAIAEVT
jgi:adenine-specific DNA-methyltransferase